MSELTINAPGADKLDEIVKESGLQINDGAEIKGAYLPFLEQFAEVISEASKINPESPTKLDEEIAGKLRKKVVKIRTGAEGMKDDRKKIHLIKGNLEQSSFNVIKNSCLLAEESLREVEEYSARQEALRIAALKNERTELLRPYCESPEMYPLGNMTEGAFNDLLNGFKLMAEQKIKAEADRLEADRLQQEKWEQQIRIDALTNERRIELATKYQYGFIGEAILGEMSDEEYEVILSDAKREFEAEKARQAKIEADNEKLRKQKEEDDKKAAKLKKETDDKLAKERADADAKIKAEKEKADNLAAQLKAKEDAEKEAKRKEDELAKQKLADEKKAAKQPDKIKLKTWVQSIQLPLVPDVKSQEAGQVGVDIEVKFGSFIKWALSEIEKL